MSPVNDLIPVERQCLESGAYTAEIYGDSPQAALIAFTREPNLIADPECPDRIPLSREVYSQFERDGGKNDLALITRLPDGIKWNWAIRQATSSSAAIAPFGSRPEIDAWNGEVSAVSATAYAALLSRNDVAIHSLKTNHSRLHRLIEGLEALTKNDFGNAYVKLSAFSDNPDIRRLMREVASQIAHGLETGVKESGRLTALAMVFCFAGEPSEESRDAIETALRYRDERLSDSERRILGGLVAYLQGDLYEASKALKHYRQHPEARVSWIASHDQFANAELTVDSFKHAWGIMSKLPISEYLPAFFKRWQELARGGQYESSAHIFEQIVTEANQESRRGNRRPLISALRFVDAVYARDPNMASSERMKNLIKKAPPISRLSLYQLPGLKEADRRSIIRRIDREGELRTTYLIAP